MAMSGRLDGRVAVITGGASGIGLECARRFVREGARVVIGDRNAEQLDAASVELGETVVVELVDVTEEADVTRMVRRAVSEFGGLDAAVNAAGFGTFGFVADHPVDAWRAVIDTDLTGVMLSVKHEAQVMRDAGKGGAIVNIASINARVPAEGMGAYCCAKAGVEMLTRVAAMELGPHGIRVSGIGPGFVETPLTAFTRVVPAIRDAYVASTPLGRAGQPDDIADVALFLVSDEGRWISGDTLFVDGASMLKAYPELHKLAGA
jgi:NAD(P)-dependent dehydrogenase (short-subunit alcohol dehydrogenase family)